MDFHSAASRLGVILLFALCCGCGGRREIVPVTGHVTVDGGQLPTDGALYFLPIEPADTYVARPGLGLFDAAGNYSVKTGASDGLVPGRYQVTVECWKSPPNMEGKPVISYLPDKYGKGTTSGLTLEVDPEARSLEFDVDVKTK